jgi:pentatricopeptide repeat protein
MKGLSKEERPDVVSYNIVIRTYRNNIRKAMHLLREMIDSGIQPNRKTFETLMFVLKHDKTVKSKLEIEAEIHSLCSGKSYPPNGNSGNRGNTVNRHNYNKNGEDGKQGNLAGGKNSHAEMK